MERIQDTTVEMQTTSATSPKTPGLVLKNRDLYGIFDPVGDIDRIIASDRGLYWGCTRFLSRYRLRLQGMHSLVVLSSSVGTDNMTLFTDLTNPPCRTYAGEPLKAGSLYLHRELLLYGTEMHEKLTLQNQTHQSLTVRVLLEWEADFKDLSKSADANARREGTISPPRRAVRKRLTVDEMASFAAPASDS